MRTRSGERSKRAADVELEEKKCYVWDVKDVRQLWVCGLLKKSSSCMLDYFSFMCGSQTNNEDGKHDIKKNMLTMRKTLKKIFFLELRPFFSDNLLIHFRRKTVKIIKICLSPCRSLEIIVSFLEFCSKRLKLHLF